MSRGWRFGAATGAGIAAGDAAFALVAALGLAGVMRFMIAYERPLHLAAGSFLIYLGYRTFFGPAADSHRDAPVSGSVLSAFGSALLLTLTNPPTIISFVAIFTVIVPVGFDAFAALALVSGVFAGSLLWWFVVTALINAARHALGPRVRGWIDRVCGAVLGVLGVVEIRRAM